MADQEAIALAKQEMDAAEAAVLRANARLREARQKWNSLVNEPVVVDPAIILEKLRPLVAEAARLLRVSPDYFTRHSRARIEHCWLRWFVWRLLRDQGNSFRSIGALTDHTHGAVMCGLRRLQSDLDTNAELAQKWDDFSRHPLAQTQYLL